jgi:NAD-dependent dihydropyrimidine dehydrogenase PreA subunit
MCEFCIEHGEGKAWYLEMKNYSDILLHEELSARQQEIVGTPTRLEWNARFLESILPATGALAPQAEDKGEAEESRPQLSEEQLVAVRKVEHFGQVLPIEDAEKVIDIADSITRLPCGCRYISTGKTNQRYCFGFGIDRLGILGKYPDAAASLEVLDKEEAKAIIRAYDEEGLMHSIWSGVTPFVVGMCNCDHDCLAYRGYIEMRGAPSFFRGEYICRTDWDECNGCRSCMSQCQFGAQFYSSALGKVYIDPTRCFGCGVCRAACPNDAIQLIPRQQEPVAADLWLGEAPL